MEQFREQIEEYGNFYEKQGFTPVAARIVVYLSLHPEGEATFEDLVQYFTVSKSAVSNALKMLSLMEVVAEKTRSGARKRYFSIAFDRFFSPESVIKSYRDNRLVLDQLRKLRKKKDKVSEEIGKISSFIKILEDEYPRLYEAMLKGKKG